jgi:hypothetical protein
MQQDRHEARRGPAAGGHRVVALLEDLERLRRCNARRPLHFLEARERILSAHQPRAFGEQLEGRITYELGGHALKRRDGSFDVGRRRIARSPVLRHRSLQIRVERHGGQSGFRTRAARHEAPISRVLRLGAQVLGEIQLSERGREQHVIAQIMQHVHDGHARSAVRGIRRELIARDSAHVQVRQRVLERATNLDASAAEARIQDHEQAAGRRIGSDAPFFVRLVRLQLDRRGVIGARNDMDVDAEIVVKRVGHPAEPRAERREDAGSVADPAVRRLHGLMCIVRCSDSNLRARLGIVVA